MLITKNVDVFLHFFATVPFEPNSASVCNDTPAWENGVGYDCNNYGKRWCENGTARPGEEWTLGAEYNYPENNCCVCGKRNGKYQLNVDHHMNQCKFYIA